MPSNSDLVCRLFFRWSLLFSGLFALSAPIGRVSGFDDGALMRDTVQKRGCHLGVAEDRDPFTELQISGDDDAGLLVELADQM